MFISFLYWSDGVLILRRSSGGDKNGGGAIGLVEIFYWVAYVQCVPLYVTVLCNKICTYLGLYILYIQVTLPYFNKRVTFTISYL